MEKLGFVLAYLNMFLVFLVNGLKSEFKITFHLHEKFYIILYKKMSF